MKLKTFFGPNMPTLMDTIRSELGEDVLIISSQRQSDGSLKIITAIETDSETTFPPNTNNGLKELLQRQHVPNATISHMLTQAKSDSLEHFLQTAFQYHPLTTTHKTPRAYCLVGPHGGGKTTAIIKLALSAKLNGLNPCILTADVIKAGAREQLISFCKIAQIPFLPLTQTADINTTLQNARGQHQFILLDTMGVSYLDKAELNFLKQLKRNTNGLEMLLTLPAGLDATESADITAVFASVGANRLIATKLDTTHFIGNILNAAFQNNMPFAAFGNNALLSEPFDIPNPQKLAALLGVSA